MRARKEGGEWHDVARTRKQGGKCMTLYGHVNREGKGMTL